MKNLKILTSKKSGQFLLLITNLVLLLALLISHSFATPANMTAVKKDIVSHLDNDVVSSDPFIGEIAIFAGNFAPRGWALCDGQILKINQHQALFSLLGTTYGGDGRTTFALPDLRGRVPMHAGQGPGLENQSLGQKTNAELLMPYFDEKYQPVLPPSSQAVHYVIALQGIFPSRN